MKRYSVLCYVKDVLIGAISCKEDIEEDGTRTCYIMTITVLKPYRRYGVGSQLLQKAIQDCMVARNITRMRLHMQYGNDQALEFYKNNDFKIVQEMPDYYTDIKPSGCYVLELDLSEKE